MQTDVGNTLKKDALWIKWIHSIYIKKKEFNSMHTPSQACWLVRKIFDVRNWYLNVESFANINRLEGESLVFGNYTLSRPQYPKVEWKAVMVGTSVPGISLFFG